MKIAVIGAGYVGLVTSACFAELGNHVCCIDVNQKKIADLKQGILPIFEAGLQTMVNHNMVDERLQFAHSLKELAFLPDVIFIAVGTPSNEEGMADVQFVLEAAYDIGLCIQKDCVVVDKSTVPVGMGERVSQIIQDSLRHRQLSIQVEVVSNPEFLREGAAIEDFMRPDRIIIGLSKKAQFAKQIMLDLYLPLLRKPDRIYFMDVKDAEMTKYVANAMLATRISFMNEMSILCEKMGVDIENVRLGIGSDARIGEAFLNAGCGYGGSCFPKDVRALTKMAEEFNFKPTILQAVEERNAAQKKLLAEKIIQFFGENLSGICLGLWGLSFKPGTDDMREASSLVLIEEILNKGGKIQAYDPAAMGLIKKLINKKWFDNKQFILCEHQYDALKDVDALVLVTEWKSFCYPDTAVMKKIMRQQIIFDGRNQYDPFQMRQAGFDYFGIGRGYEINSTLPYVKLIQN